MKLFRAIWAKYFPKLQLNCFFDKTFQITGGIHLCSKPQLFSGSLLCIILYIFCRGFSLLVPTSNTVMPRRATLKIYSFRYLKCKTTFQSVFTHKSCKGMSFPHKSLFLSEISCVLKRLFGLVSHPLPNPSGFGKKSGKEHNVKVFCNNLSVVPKKTPINKQRKNKTKEKNNINNSWTLTIKVSFPKAIRFRGNLFELRPFLTCFLWKL